MTETLFLKICQFSIILLFPRYIFIWKKMSWQLIRNLRDNEDSLQFTLFNTRMILFCPVCPTLRVVGEQEYLDFPHIRPTLPCRPAFAFDVYTYLIDQLQLVRLISKRTLPTSLLPVTLHFFSFVFKVSLEVLCACVCVSAGAVIWFNSNWKSGL